MAEIVDFGLQQHKIKMDSRYFENVLSVVAGDTGRRIEVQLLDTNGMVQDTTGLNLRLNAEIAGKATFTDATLVDAATGKYQLDLSNGMFLAPGNWQFQWQITDSAGKKLHSFAFTGNIGKNISEGGSQATNFYLNLEDLKAMQDDLVNGTIDSSILETNITEKLTNLETQYAPKLTEVTAQLAENEWKKADITYVDQSISRISGGAIKGTYTTLASLKAAYPQGAVGPFQVEENGNRYVWDVNKLEWVSIGPYDPANIAESSVTYDKTTFEHEVSVRAENIILNGNFAKDSNNDGVADGWTARANATLPRVENNSQYWTPTSTGWSGSVEYLSSESVISGHKYYVSFEKTNVYNVYLPNSASLILQSNVNGRISTVFSASTNERLILSFYGEKTSVQSSIKNVIVVDLTSTFGKGSEPTKEYFEHLLMILGATSWFDIINFTDARKNGIITAKDLKVYDPKGVLQAETVEDSLIKLSDDSVELKKELESKVSFISGKNFYNPVDNTVGTIKRSPTVGVGMKQEIDVTDNPANHETQIIKINNEDDITITNVNVYSVTDLNSNVVVSRRITDGLKATILSTNIPLDEYLLWVSVSPENINAAQIEKGSVATSYEPCMPVKAIYANGVKLFDYPFDFSIEGGDDKTIYDLAKAELERQQADELVTYLLNNAKVANQSFESYAKDVQTIPLKDKLSAQKMILHLHKRENDGFGEYNNAYLPNAKSDFSDVRVTTDKGETLPYRVSYKANDFDIVPYNWVRNPSGQIASPTFTDSKGILYQSQQHIQKSVDKGKTWTIIPALEQFSKPYLNIIAQDDTMYFNVNSKLYRSESPYETYQEVLDLDPISEFAPVHISGKSMVQHPDGELFCGLYQASWRINIFKSTDNGLTWSLSADFGNKYQHVHGMFVDEYQNPPAVYAGLDGGGGVLKTTDKGGTWVDLREQNPNMPQATDYGVRYADPSGYRLLGGETPIVGGHSIIKTYDDKDFTPVLSDGMSVNYIIKLGEIMFATGSGSNGFINGAIYVSCDDAETWESVYRTAPLLGSRSANDGYRYMEQISDNEIFVGPQSMSIPPLRIFGEGSYAELIVDVPAGASSLIVESGHTYPNELPLANDVELIGEKIVHFELNDNSSVIKETVSENLFKDDFEWAKVGKHLSYFYPYITSPRESNSVLLNSLSGYDISLENIDVTQGLTISFWTKLSKGTRFVMFENEHGDILEIIDGYQMHLNGINLISFGSPTIPNAFIKYDIIVKNDGETRVFNNGLIMPTIKTGGPELINVFNKGGAFKFFRNVIAGNEDSMQHFVIRKGAISEEQSLREYNGNVRDNIDK